MIKRLLIYANVEFVKGLPVAVYWGENEDGEHEFYAGILKQVSPSAVVITMNFGGEEILRKDDFGNVVALAEPLIEKTPYTQAQVAKARPVRKEVVKKDYTESLFPKDVIDYFHINTDKNRDKFSFDFNDTTANVKLVFERLKTKTKEFNTVESFQNYVQSASGFWSEIKGQIQYDTSLVELPETATKDDVQLAFRQFNDSYYRYQDKLAESFSSYANKLVGSKKRNASFDFDLFFKRYRLPKEIYDTVNKPSSRRKYIKTVASKKYKFFIERDREDSNFYSVYVELDGHLKDGDILLNQPVIKPFSQTNPIYLKMDSGETEGDAELQFQLTVKLLRGSIDKSIDGQLREGNPEHWKILAGNSYGSRKIRILRAMSLYEKVTDLQLSELVETLDTLHYLNYNLGEIYQNIINNKNASESTVGKAEQGLYRWERKEGN